MMSSRDKDLKERITLHALGLLKPNEAQVLESELSDGDAAELAALRETVAEVAFTAASEPPPAGLKDRLLEAIDADAGGGGPQVWKSWMQDHFAGIHVVRSEQGLWETTSFKGIRVKRLYSNPQQDSVTMLIRMEPGSEYPAHRHGGPEQCLVLEGDLSVGDLVLRGGDYSCASASSTHAVSRTEGGCLLLIVSSQHDELLA